MASKKKLKARIRELETENKWMKWLLKDVKPSPIVEYFTIPDKWRLPKVISVGDDPHL